MPAKPATPREVLIKAACSCYGKTFGSKGRHACNWPGCKCDLWPMMVDGQLAALATANCRIAGPDEAVVKIPSGHSIMFVKTSVESMSANVKVEDAHD